MTVKELKELIDSESDETIVYFTLGQLVVSVIGVNTWSLKDINHIEFELSTKRINA